MKSNPVRRIFVAAAAMLGMSGTRVPQAAAMNIQPGPYHLNDAVRTGGNKPAGAFHYQGRGGRARNPRKVSKKLRYASNYA